MGRLSATDVRGVLGYLAGMTPGTPADPVPRPTLAGLRDLLGADDAEYFELRRADRGVVAASSSDEITSAPGTEEAMVRFGAQNPLAWRRWTPADGAMRLSEHLGRRDLERLDFFQAFMWPNRLRDTLKVWLWSSAMTAACVQLWRSGSDFSRREQDLLGVVHEHLIAARALALARPVAPGAEASLTRRESEVVTWLATGATDDDIARRLGASTATVGKHLENLYAKLGVHSRSEAIGRILFGPAPRAD